MNLLSVISNPSDGVNFGATRQARELIIASVKTDVVMQARLFVLVMTCEVDFDCDAIITCINDVLGG